MVLARPHLELGSEQMEQGPRSTKREQIIDGSACKAFKTPAPDG